MIYLIHFSRPFKHARHYLGYAEDIDARLARHYNGRGSRLCQIVAEAGIELTIVRKWNGDRKRERAIKNLGRSGCVLCPICNPNGWNRHAVVGTIYPERR